MKGALFAIGAVVLVVVAVVARVSVSSGPLQKIFGANNKWKCTDGRCVVGTEGFSTLRECTLACGTETSLPSDTGPPPPAPMNPNSRILATDIPNDTLHYKGEAYTIMNPSLDDSCGGRVYMNPGEGKFMLITQPSKGTVDADGKPVIRTPNDCKKYPCDRCPWGGVPCSATSEPERIQDAAFEVTDQNTGEKMTAIAFTCVDSRPNPYRIAEQVTVTFMSITPGSKRLMLSQIRSWPWGATGYGCVTDQKSQVDSSKTAWPVIEMLSTSGVEVEVSKDSFPHSYRLNGHQAYVNRGDSTLHNDRARVNEQANWVRLQDTQNADLHFDANHSASNPPQYFYQMMPQLWFSREGDDCDNFKSPYWVAGGVTVDSDGVSAYPGGRGVVAKPELLRGDRFGQLQLQSWDPLLDKAHMERIVATWNTTMVPLNPRGEF